MKATRRGLFANAIRAGRSNGRKTVQFGRYFVAEFGVLLAIFLAIGLLLNYLWSLATPETALAAALKTLSDAFILAVPIGSLTGFVIDRNLTLIANCHELGLKGIYRHKRDEAAVDVMNNMLTRARKALLIQTEHVELRFASITAKQIFHADGELRREFRELLDAGIGTGANRRFKVEVLLLHPFSANAAARAESEEWKKNTDGWEMGNGERPVLRHGRLLDDTWNCPLFQDASVTYREVAKLLENLRRRGGEQILEIRYSDQMPIFLFGLRDEALIGVHNLSAWEARGGKWRGLMPVYHHRENNDLSSEALDSFSYSWAKATSYDEFRNELLALSAHSRISGDETKMEVPPHILTMFEPNRPSASSEALDSAAVV